MSVRSICIVLFKSDVSLLILCLSDLLLRLVYWRPQLLLYCCLFLCLALLLFALYIYVLQCYVWKCLQLLYFLDELTPLSLCRERRLLVLVFLKSILSDKYSYLCSLLLLFFGYHLLEISFSIPSLCLCASKAKVSFVFSISLDLFFKNSFSHSMSFDWRI